MQNSAIHLILLVFFFILMGCSALQLQPNVELVSMENRINKIIYIEDFRIINTEGDGQRDILKYFGRNVSDDFKQYLIDSELFSNVEALRDNADIYVKGILTNKSNREVKIKNRTKNIYEYDINLEFYDKNGRLLNTFYTNYSISKGNIETGKSLEQKLNEAYEITFSSLIKAIIADRETLLNNKN